MLFGLDIEFLWLVFLEVVCIPGRNPVIVLITSVLLNVVSYEFSFLIFEIDVLLDSLDLREKPKTCSSEERDST